MGFYFTIKHEPTVFKTKKEDLLEVANFQEFFSTSKRSAKIVYCKDEDKQ